MITTLLLLAATATTPALPAVTPDTIDFEAAKALADRDEKAMTKLAADAMKKSQWGVLARATEACRTDEKPAPFTVVLELDAAGKATRHWRDSETGLAKCMDDKLARQAFYIPGKAPFSISFEVTFAP